MTALFEGFVNRGRRSSTAWASSRISEAVMRLGFDLCLGCSHRLWDQFPHRRPAGSMSLPHCLSNLPSQASRARAWASVPLPATIYFCASPQPLSPPGFFEVEVLPPTPVFSSVCLLSSQARFYLLPKPFPVVSKVTVKYTQSRIPRGGDRDKKVQR